MEYFIALVAVGGFAYFVYTRVRKNRADRPSGTYGTGGRPNDPGRQEAE